MRLTERRTRTVVPELVDEIDVQTDQVDTEGMERSLQLTAEIGGYETAIHAHLRTFRERGCQPFLDVK